MAHESHVAAPLAAERTTTGPGGRTVVWRVAWRERQDGALAIEREAWVDDEGEAWERKAEVERRGCLGMCLVYRVDVYDEGAA